MQMKQKNMIVAAVVAAISSSPALADTANVTIYGVADMSIDTTYNGDTSAGAQGARATKVSSNTSLLGFKGEEDLGDGLKAIWQIESEVDLDGTTAATTTAASTAANTFLGTRNTFAGLKSDNCGTLILGRHDTPYKTSDRRLDLFGNHVSDNRALMGGGQGKGSADTKGYDKRATDIAIYNSPVMGGFKATAGYVAGAESVTVDGVHRGNIWSLSGTYDVAPFYGMLAYQKNDYGNAGTGIVVANTNGASANTNERAWKVGGGYKVDQFIINAIIEKTHDNFGGPVATNAFCKNAATGASCYGHSAFYVAGQYNLTSTDAVKLAYTKANNLQDGNAANTGAKHASIGYDHKMSKRTNVYATYTKLTNDANVAYSLNGEVASTANIIAPGPGACPFAFSLGMMHTF